MSSVENMSHDLDPPEGVVPPHAAAGARRSQSLTTRTLESIGWRMSGSMAEGVLRVGVLVILARLLSPTDFGVVAAALVVVQFAQLFSYVGIGPAIVQRAELTDRHIATGFTISIIAGLVLAAVLWAVAPLMAAFFRLPELTGVLRVVFLVFPIRGLAIVAESLLRRDLRFRVITWTGVVSYFIGYGVIGVALALVGVGVWALVGAFLVQSVLITAFELFYQRHAKRLGIDRQSARDLLGFGGGITGISLINIAALQGDNVVAGRWLGAAALGIYGRAYNLMAAGASLFGGVLDEVIFPAMSRIQSERERLALAYRRGLTLVTLVLLPISVFVVITAPEVIAVLLGRGWAEAVAPFQFLAPGILLRTAYKTGASLMRATGALAQAAWQQGTYAVLVVTLAWVGQHWGVAGLALGVLVALIANHLIVGRIVGRLIGFPATEFFRAHVPGALLAIAVGSASFAVAAPLRAAGVGAAIELLLALTAALAVAIGLLFAAPRLLLGEEGTWMLRQLAAYLPSGGLANTVRRRLDRLASPGAP